MTDSRSMARAWATAAVLAMAPIAVLADDTQLQRLAFGPPPAWTGHMAASLGWQTSISKLPSASVTLPRTRTSAAGPHALAGIASFYWQDQRTANGETFDKMAMTAAHPTLPFNTRVRVTHRGNGRSVDVRINDRGPFKPGRVIDLSLAAAGALDMQKQGLAEVTIEVLDGR